MQKMTEKKGHKTQHKMKKVLRRTTEKTIKAKQMRHNKQRSHSASVTTNKKILEKKTGKTCKMKKKQKWDHETNERGTNMTSWNKFW